MSNLLIAVFYSPSIVEDSGAQSHPFVFFFRFKRPWTGSCFQRDLVVFPFLSVVGTYMVTCFSDIESFIPSLDSAYPASENSGYRILYDYANAVYESSPSTTFHCSPSCVTFTYDSSGRLIFRALLTVSGGLANTRRGRPL